MAREAGCRVLVVEDDAKFADSLRALLETYGVVARFAADLRQARAAMEARPPDVAFVDLDLPDGDGVQLIAEWTERVPHVPLVVLSVVSGAERVLAALSAGAVGYLLKADAGGERIVQAIAEARAGGAPLSGPIARLLLRRLRSAPERPSEPAPALTARETLTLQLLADGNTYASAADELGVSINTVRSYVRSIYEKFAVGSKTEAVLAAMRLGIVRPRAPTD